MRYDLLTICTVMALLAAGCGEDDIRVYTAPRDELPAQASQMPDAAQAPSAADAEPLTWTLPDGWTVQRGSGMRFATVTIDSGPPALELTIIPLGAMAGDVLDNVNRWRGQVSLEPLTAEQLPEHITTLAAGSQSLALVDLVANDNSQRIVAAMTEHDGRVWFFKTIGPAAAIESHIADINTFLKSLRFGAEAQTNAAPPQAAAPANTAPMDSTPVIPTPVGDWTITYDTPASWRVDTNASSMRIASFIIGPEDDSEMQGEVSVTRFPGQVGGLLANINRWRGQVGLETLTDLRDQDLLPITIDNQQAAGLDIIEPAADAPAEDERKRMVVVILPRPTMTWFFKMSGPSATLEQNQDAFAAFVTSIKYVKEEK